MPYEVESPLAAAGAFAASYAAAQQAKQQQEQERARQARIDEDQRRALAFAQAMQTSELGDRRRNQGLDPTTGQPLQLPQTLTQIRPNNHGRGPAMTPEQHRDLAWRTATWFAAQGAAGPAKQYEKVASDIDRSIHKAQQDAERFRVDTNNRLHQLAQERHWTAQERQAAQNEADRLYLGIRRGDVQLDVAQQQIAAKIAGITMRDQTDLTLQGLKNAGGVARVNAQQSRIDQRFNAGQQNITNRSDHPDATTLTVGAPGGVDPIVAEGIAAGKNVPRAQRARMLQQAVLAGVMTQAQANAILKGLQGH